MGNKSSSSKRHTNQAFEMRLKAKEWQYEIGREAKRLDKEVQKLKHEELKLQGKIKEEAAKGNVHAVQLLAKSVVRTRKAAQRMEKTKPLMENVKLQLTTSMASASTTYAFSLSADIVRQMNAIARIPEAGGTIEEMRRQMAMAADAEDAIEAALVEEGEEQEAALEVQKVLEEMSLDKMGPLADLRIAQVAPAAQAPQLPVSAPRQAIAVGEEQVAPAHAKAVATSQAAPEPSATPVPTEAPAAEDDVMRRIDLLQSSISPTKGRGPVLSQEDDLMARIDALKKS